MVPVTAKKTPKVAVTFSMKELASRALEQWSIAKTAKEAKRPDLQPICIESLAAPKRRATATPEGPVLQSVCSRPPAAPERRATAAPEGATEAKH